MMEEGRRLKKIAELTAPPGSRIEMLYSSDPYSPIPPGTRGTVEFIDDVGTLHMRWDNGRTLGMVIGQDQFKVLRRGPA